LAESPAVVAFKTNQPVRDVIFVEKIVELAAFARTVLPGDSQAANFFSRPPKFLLPPQPAPPHDERAYDPFAHARQLRERPPEPDRGHFQNLALIRFPPPAGPR